MYQVCARGDYNPAISSGIGSFAESGFHDAGSSETFEGAIQQIRQSKDNEYQVFGPTRTNPDGTRQNAWFVVKTSNSAGSDVRIY